MFAEHRLEVLGCPSCALSIMGGFGDDAEIQQQYPVLNHALVPFLGHTIYLRNVSTLAQALAYAAGGFHVSVARGLAGGCGDRADGFMEKMGLFDGKNLGTCARPLANPEIRRLWAQAAQLYLDAFNIGQTTKSLAKTKEAIVRAQSMGVSPYSMEGVTPPRDPGPGSSSLPEPDVEIPTPTMAVQRGVGPGAVMAAGIGLVSVLALGLGIAGTEYHKRRKRRGA